MRHTLSWLPAFCLLPVFAFLVGAGPVPAPAASLEDEKLLKAAKIGVDGPGLLDFFRQHTTGPAQQEHILALIQQLGDASFSARQKASADLAALGPRAVSYLRGALNDPDEEIKDRVEYLLKNVEGMDSQAAQSAAAARLIRARAPADAAVVLLAYVPDADNDAVEEEVLASLAVLAVHDGKVDAPIVAALKDKQSSRRAAAGLALGRSGTPEQRSEVHALLLDADARVRFRAAQGLMAGRDHAALLALVALVKDGPTDLAYRADELLSCVTRLSHVPFAEDAATRQNCYRTWANWSVRYSKAVDLNRAAVELPAFNPALRAREVVRQCFNAMVQNDLAAFKKTIGLPFLFGGQPAYTKTDDLDRFFNQRPLGVQGQPWTPLIVGMASLEEYQGNGAQENEKQFIKALPNKSDILAFIVQPQQIGALNPNSEPNQGNLFLVRLSGDQPSVIGLSQGRSGFRINR
jgi:HEAT repeat protein